jgi:hypothetical protein
MHVSKDVSYGDNDIILLGSKCEPWRDVWIVTNGKYQIVDKNAFNNFQILL